MFHVTQVQLSQKPDGVNVQERVITIKGEKMQLISASNIIIDKIKDDPQSASCPHISYSGVVGPVANANPTGSPYAAGSTLIDSGSNVATMLGHYIIPGHQQMVQTTALPYLHHSSGAATPAPAADLGPLNPSAFGNYSYALSVIPSLHQGIPTLTGAANNVIPVANSMSPMPPATPLLSTTAFQQDGGIQAARALSLPGSYITGPGAAAYLATSQQQLVSAAQPSFSTMAAYQHPATVSSPSSLSIASAPATPALSTHSYQQHQGQQQQQQQQHQGTVSLIGIEKSSDGQHETIDLAVPENLIGAILGRNGRTLLEYQQISGAKIQISKKGDHIPGTRNRRVSITGRPPCPGTAQLLITSRIATTQTARAQQLKLM